MKTLCVTILVAAVTLAAFGNDEKCPVAEKPAQQSMVEIAAVNIGNCFHLLSSKKIGPQTLRSKTLFRVGRTVRLDMNLLTGSMGNLPNIFFGRNRVRRNGKAPGLYG